MSNIEDRDEQTYLNGFEEQTELPFDWDSEEVQGTVAELKADPDRLREEVLKRIVAKMYEDMVDADHFYKNGFEEQTELPYDWDSEEAQGTKEELKAETIHINSDHTTVTLLDDGERAQMLVEVEKFSGEERAGVTSSNTAKDTLFLIDSDSIEAFKMFVSTLYGKASA